MSHQYQLGFHSFKSFLGSKPPWKRWESFSECLLRLLSVPGKRHSAQHKQGGGGVPPLRISPAHSSPHLPNKDGRLCHQFLWRTNHVFVDCIYHNHATSKWLQSGKSIAFVIVYVIVDHLPVHYYKVSPQYSLFPPFINPILVNSFNNY